MASSCVPLRLRSNYSLLSGVARVGEIVDRAVALGLPAVALTDTNNLYAAIPFYKLARARGIKSILGADVAHVSGRATLLLAGLIVPAEGPVIRWSPAGAAGPGRSAWGRGVGAGARTGVAGAGAAGMGGSRDGSMPSPWHKGLSRRPSSGEAASIATISGSASSTRI